MSYIFAPWEESDELDAIGYAEFRGSQAGKQFVENNETLIDNPYKLPKATREQRDAWFKGHVEGRNS